MSTSVRRLTNDDVKTIFDCVFNNKRPKEKRLTFNIIPVGPQGMKLSPPSYEFDDGLYILLKPIKRMKNGSVGYYKKPEDDPRIPSNLKSLVFSGKPKETCPWSLSGPQFPVPTSIQQRYCYPKGDPEYSNKKGGALWTVYDENGKEDLEYRLLHVYYSAKRAGNTRKPYSIAYSTPKKKRKASNHELVESTPPRVDTASFSSGSFDSPLSFDMPISPVDPSIFRNVFPKLTSTTTDNAERIEDESMITPDRSALDQGSTTTRNNDYHHSDLKYHPPPRSQNQQQMYSGPTSSHPRNSRMVGYTMHHNSHYYPPPPPYSHWHPVQCLSHPPQYQEYQESHHTSSPWCNSLPSSKSVKQHSYPVQQVRKSIKVSF